jgi:hypothetical protein
MGAVAEHAPLPPSFAPVWGHCSAAILASMQAPNNETEETRTGEATHWVLAEVLRNFQGKQEGPLTCAAYIGQVAPNGVVIDDEMAEGAQVAVSDVLEIAQKHGALQSMLIEHRVHMPAVHPQNWGTLDCAIVLRKDDQVVAIYLWDYKNGHRENRAKHNLQLIEYAEGLREELGINGHQEQHVYMIFRIVQPFSYSANGPVDEWECMLSDIRGHVNGLEAKAHEAFSNPQMTTGKHCRDCPGKRPCSARRRADYNLIDLANEPYEMDVMSGADLATERLILSNGLAAAKARLDAIEENLIHRIGEGETGTGLALESKYGHLAFTVPPEQAAALATQFGFDISKFAVKTPTQAIQAAPKEVRVMFEQVLKTMTKRPAGKLKLINADDSRTARAFKRK